MKKRFLAAVTLFISSLGFASSSPVGYWDQYSDKNQQLQSIVQIFQDGSELKGRIVKGFPVDGKAPNHYCTRCSGNLKNKRITDITFIWGLTQTTEPNKWSGGHILDPESGNTYRLTTTLNADGSQLNVRAYLGIPLLGRSQTWVRITDKQMKQQLADIYKAIGNQ